MRIRELFKRHPAATVGVMLLLTALAVASIVYQLRPDDELPLIPRKDFYTVDDGQTWFADDGNKPTPFDHGGTPAVMARLFSCDGGKTRFVGYLEKLPDGAVETFRTRNHLPADATPEADDVAEVAGSLIKRKGESEWVPSSDSERFHQITDVHCPGGGANAERVFPE